MTLFILYFFWNNYVEFDLNLILFIPRTVGLSFLDFLFEFIPVVLIAMFELVVETLIVFFLEISFVWVPLFAKLLLLLFLLLILICLFFCFFIVGIFCLCPFYWLVLFGLHKSVILFLLEKISFLIHKL